MNSLHPVGFSKSETQLKPLDLNLAQKLPLVEVILSGNLRALSCVSDRVVWVSGSVGNVFRTVDGGCSWLSCRINSSLDFRSMHAFNEKEACAASAGFSKEGHAVIVRTEDSGATWNEVLNIKEAGYFINGMKFWNSDNGIAICDPVKGYFRFFLTENGGRSWKLMDENPQLHSFHDEVVFAASNSCMSLHGSSEIWFTASGSSPRIFHSSDRGRSWEANTIPIKLKGRLSGIFSIAFRNLHDGIAVGGDYISPESFMHANIFVTQDGGKTWTPLPSEFEKKCLFCVVWDRDKPIIVEGGAKTYHSAACSDSKIWMAGQDKIAFANRLKSDGCARIV